MANRLLPGYQRANSNNLPTLDIIMLRNYIQKDVNYISPEIANVNSLRAGRESYGESAIGWVQVHRHENVFTVLGVIAPEHNVTSKNYIVEVKIDIEKYEIFSAICKSCVAHQGGCKHHIAFIGWIHRRSEEPTKTEVECYWKKKFIVSSWDNN